MPEPPSIQCDVDFLTHDLGVFPRGHPVGDYGACLESERVSYVGYAAAGPPARLGNASNVRYTPIQDFECSDGFTFETPFGRPDLRFYYASIRNLEAFLDPTAVAEENEVILACETLLGRVDGTLAPLCRPLNTYESINGIDGSRHFKSMDFSTSAGPPLKGVKSDHFPFEEGNEPRRRMGPAVERLYRDFIARLSSGRNCTVYYKACFKDEPRLPGKYARLFSAAPSHVVVAMRQYFSPITALLVANQDRLGIMIGLNPESREWDAFARRLCRHGFTNVRDGDYSRFDKNQAKNIILAILEIIIPHLCRILLYTAKQTKLTMALFRLVVYPWIMFGRDVFQIWGFNISGWPWTTMLNCLVNLIYAMLAYGDVANIATFFDNVEIGVFGDDVIWSSSKFTFEHFQRGMQRRNVKFTSASKDGQVNCGLDKVTFLKRSFRFDDATSRYFAPLLDESIMKMVCLVSKRHAGQSTPCFQTTVE